MKQSFALFLVLSTLLSVAFPYSVHTAPAEESPTTTSLTTSIPSEPSQTEESPLPEDPSLPEEPTLPEEPPVTHEPTVEEALLATLYTTVNLGNSEYIHVFPTEPESGLIERVCTALLSDYPEFFHLDRITVEHEIIPQPDELPAVYQYRFAFTYLFSQGEELDNARAFIQQQTEEILSLIPENADTLRTLLFLHDYICTHFSYVASMQHRDIYCLLEDGLGNCQAYSNLYSYLLDQLGIENEFVISTEMNHIWNQVKLGDDWYHVDLCWDDPAVDQTGRALHSNFLRSDAGISSTNHYGFTAPHPCESTIYENNFFLDLGGAVIDLNRYSYAISRGQRAILQIDWANMTATPVVDLSALRWYLWNSPDTRWKEQYLNLYTDGWYIYFNGPSSIWRYDTELHQVDLLHEFNSENGFLYSLTGNGHTLTCTVSKAPGQFDEFFQFETAHEYSSEGDRFYSVESCLICAQAGAIYTPNEEAAITAGISTRPSQEGYHDLRLLLFINYDYLSNTSALNVKLSFLSGEDERFAMGILTLDERENFLLYESFWADGIICTVTDGYEINGLILQSLADGSYDHVVVSITQDDQQIYYAFLPAELIFNPPEEPEEPEEPLIPSTDDPIDAPLSSDSEEDVSLPTTQDQTGEDAVTNPNEDPVVT